jgi:ABC-type multidrug transport system ATPase subunit
MQYLFDARNRMAANYSGGMRRRLDIKYCHPTRSYFS